MNTVRACTHIVNSLNMKDILLVTFENWEKSYSIMFTSLFYYFVRLHNLMFRQWFLHLFQVLVIKVAQISVKVRSSMW